MLLGYLRHSVHAAQSEDVQRAALRAAGVRDTDMVVEFAIGGDRRPVLNRCIVGLQPGDVLVASQLDRVGRSLTELIATVLAVRDRGAHLRCLDGAIDTSAVGGRKTFELFGALAAYENALTREQEQARMAVTRRRGRPLAGPSEKEIEKILAALDRGAKRQAVCRAFNVHLQQLEALLKQRGRNDPAD